MPNVRIHNTTGADLETVLLYPPASPREPIDFGSIASGGYSDYRDVDTAYRFAHVEASGPIGSYVLRPYDYVGEEPLPEGRWTYRLSIDQGRLALALEEGTDEQDE
jgi:hypothetical protein